ncbi:M24 family metallopeptidase [Zhaonella formicivorans]|uniref:M24 family metallopeptidase n=1 Tax=Zhaonella formicivorans TaxID=2528593 RepID=UPI0010DF874C|nr:Xaa-Pro peptidase family protein [Zhaonella formicivorans]
MFKTVPAQEIEDRLARLQVSLDRTELDSCLIGSNVNLFYFTGTIQMSYLYVPSSGDPILFVRKDMARAREESPLKEIVDFKKPEDIPRILKDKGCPLPKNIGMELEQLSAKEYLRLEKIFSQSRVGDCSLLLRQIRVLKSVYEIGQLKESAAKAALVYSEIPNFIKPGMTDLELAAAIEHRSRLLGHIGLVRFHGVKQEFFFGQVLAGENGLVPTGYDTALGGRGLTPAFPKSVAGETLKEHSPILVDYSANYNGYNVDLTRIYSIGQLPQSLLDAQQVAVEIQETIAAAAKPGVSCAELYGLALELAARYRLQDNFMGYSQQAQFVGHGIGLEVNELPVLAAKFNTELQAGMVLAIEPKFAFPGLGAVGIENTYVVGNNGLEKITIVPEDIISV